MSSNRTYLEISLTYSTPYRKIMHQKLIAISKRKSLLFMSVGFFTKYLGGGVYIIIPINLFLSLFFWHVSTLKGHLQRIIRNERAVINSNFGKDLLTKLQKINFYNYPNEEGWGIDPLFDSKTTEWLVLATWLNRFFYTWLGCHRAYKLYAKYCHIQTSIL